MRILRLIAKAADYGSGLTLISMMVLTMANAFSRYFFNSPISGATEIGAYQLLLIVGLGLGAAGFERRHIKVDLVMDHLPKGAQLVIDVAMLIVTFIYLGIMTWANARQAVIIPTRYTAAIGIPDTPFKWVFAVGWGLCCLGSLYVLIETLQNWKRGKKE
jgi:TRAP-type C4-dicarboxylate transport system permease small subunit